MERPKTHEIDTAAQRIFQAMMPVSWVVREQHPDYGIDYEIEVFRDQKPAGIWFRVQLKGTEEWHEADGLISISFETDKIKYYLEKVPFPVFLLLVDVGKKQVVWLFLQRYVNEILMKENPSWPNQKTATLHIPAANTLEKNHEAVEEEAEKGMQYCHILRFGTPHWSIPFKVSGAIEDLEKFEEARKRHFAEQNEMDLHLAVRYYEVEDREKSHEYFREVFERTKGKKEHVNEHLSSAAGLVSFYSLLRKDENFEAFKLSDYARRIAESEDNRRFIYYFRGSQLEALFYELNRSIRNNQIIQLVIEGQGRGLGTQSLMKLFQLEDYGTLMRASEDYSRNILEAFENKEYVVALDLMIRLIRIHMVRYRELITEHTKDDLKPLREGARTLIENALSLAAALKRPDLECEVLKYTAHLLHYENRDEYNQVLADVKELALKNKLHVYVKVADELQERLAKEGRFPEGPDDFAEEKPLEDLTDDEIDNLYRKLAEITGIDLEDKDDDIARVVRIGLKDRNPERVLKNCSNLEIAHGSYGIPGEMLGLPSAGSKFLFCIYGGGIYGFDLDSLYDSMKEDYCENCEHRDPMPEGWKWSYSWQEEREKNRSTEFQNFIDLVYRR